MKRKSLVLLCLFVPAVVAAHSTEKEEGWFVPAPFCKPFISEMEGTLSKAEIGYGKSHPDYTINDSLNRKYMPYLNVSLGVSLPVYLLKLPKDWTIALSLPISFHLWLDLKELSAPVLNTDYRFAVGELKALKLLRRKRWPQNISLRFAPFCHESTHIGDELTIYRATQPRPVTRANVSYEYMELSATLNDPCNSRETMHSLRFGMLSKLPGKERWYKIYPHEGDTTLNHASRIHIEFYFQYQFQRATGFLASRNFNNVLSAEMRSRAQYGFPQEYRNEDGSWYFTPNREDKRTYNFNIYYGWQCYPKSTRFMNSVGFYAHFYQGIVPYGQFRNINNYTYFGISVIISQ